MSPFDLQPRGPAVRTDISRVDAARCRAYCRFPAERQRRASKAGFSAPLAADCEPSRTRVPDAWVGRISIVRRALPTHFSFRVWLSDQAVRESAQHARGGALQSRRARRPCNELRACDGRDGRFRNPPLQAIQRARPGFSRRLRVNPALWPTLGWLLLWTRLESMNRSGATRPSPGKRAL